MAGRLAKAIKEARKRAERSAKDLPSDSFRALVEAEFGEIEAIVAATRGQSPKRVWVKAARLIKDSLAANGLDVGFSPGTLRVYFNEVRRSRSGAVGKEAPVKEAENRTAAHGEVSETHGGAGEARAARGSLPPSHITPVHEPEAIDEAKPVDGTPAPPALRLPDRSGKQADLDRIRRSFSPENLGGGLTRIDG